jgi:hypothetical protein
MISLPHRWPLLIAVLVTGCERYPDQPVFVYGRAQRVDGSPWSNAPLGFERRANLEGPDAAGEASAAFAPYKTLTTTPEGAFTLELPAADAEDPSPMGSQTYRFRVCTPPERGAMAIASFTFNAQDVELPSLRPWDAALTVHGSAADPVVTFGPPPAAPEKPASAKLPVLFDSQGSPQLTPPTPPNPVVQLTSQEALLWQETREPGAWTPSPWVLEDFADPQVQLRALSLGEWLFEPLWGGSSEVTFRLEWRSTREPLPCGTRHPLSRGATCAPWSAPGPCPWTDGQLAPVRLSDTQQDATEVGITLPARARLSRAVIRGLRAEGGFFADQTLVIEGSASGSDWHKLASVPIPRTSSLEPRAPFASVSRLWAADSPLDGPLMLNGSPLFLDVPLTSPVPVRRVRLYAENPEGRRTVLSSLAELSLFE